MKFILVTAAVLGAAAANNCGNYPADGFTDNYNDFAFAPKPKVGLCGASWCDGNSQVVHDRTYSMATLVCAAAGMRLPTYFEAVSGAASGSGCGSDSYGVYTSTPCADGETIGHLTFEWFNGVQTCVEDDGSSTGLQVIRCVADNTASPTAYPTASPTASPTGAPTTAEEGAAAALLDDLAGLPHRTGQDGDTVYKCMFDLCVMSTGADRGSWDLVQEADIPVAMGAHLEHDVTGGKFSVDLDGIQYVGDAGTSFEFPWTCACA